MFLKYLEWHRLHYKKEETYQRRFKNTIWGESQSSLYKNINNRVILVMYMGMWTPKVRVAKIPPQVDGSRDRRFRGKDDTTQSFAHKKSKTNHTHEEILEAIQLTKDRLPSWKGTSRVVPTVEN